MKLRVLCVVLSLSVLGFVLTGCATTGGAGASGDVVLEPDPAEVNVISIPVESDLSLIIDEKIKNELDYTYGSVDMRLVEYRSSLERVFREAFRNNFTKVPVREAVTGSGLELHLKRATIEPTTAIKFHAELLRNGDFITDISGTTEARTVLKGSTVFTYVADTKKISKQLIEEAILKTADHVYDGIMRNQNLIDQNFWEIQSIQQGVSVFQKPQKIALDLVLASEIEHGGYGFSVSVSADGSTYVISRPVNKISTGGVSKHVGSAFVYEGKGSNSKTSLYDSTALELLYGAATAVSADGSLIAIGAPGTSPANKSYFYTYLKSPNGWVSDKDVYPTLFGFPGNKGWQLGIDIDMSGPSGTTVLLGAPGHNNGAGRALYFVQPSGGWSRLNETNIQQGYLGLGQAKNGDEFGRSVSISRDDSRIAIGAPGRNGDRGGIYVFQRPSGGWLQTRELTPIEFSDSSAGDRVGQSVAISKDGSIIAVGAPGADEGKGRIYVIVNLVTASGAYQGKYDRIALDNVEGCEGLGISVDISADGKTIAAGAMGSPRNGTVQIYKSKSGNWTDAEVIETLSGKLDEAAQKDCLLGFSLALTDDGDDLLIGAPNFNNGSGTTTWSDLTKY